MADILNKIAAYKHKEVARLKQEFSVHELERKAEMQSPPRGFLSALQARAQTGPALIAEIKKASPSQGLIRKDFNPVNIATAYEKGGATCLSVLTDGPSFQGDMHYMGQAKSASTLPVLRKDFMVDPVQIIQSRASGADAILIIMAMVSDKLAQSLLGQATRLGMDALVETHSPDEMRRAVDCGATFIGINNRNLKTFETKLSTFEALAPLAPKTAFLVAESGIHSFANIEHLTAQGAQAFLVGESLMRQDDVRKATQILLGFGG